MLFRETRVDVERAQRKLDEILRVLPGADPRLLHLETATEDELHAVGQRHDQIRADALGGHRS